tara:strand:+ start:99 stop:416 length:318 start_codon:yes stop_codon:yes gene_type:complete
MSFSSNLKEESALSIWREQKELGGRLIATIPFESSEEDMEGFISTLGSESSEYKLPVLTFCVNKPSGGLTISTIVFPDIDIYSGFINKLLLDAHTSFPEITRYYS